MFYIKIPNFSADIGMENLVGPMKAANFLGLSLNRSLNLLFVNVQHLNIMGKWSIHVFTGHKMYA